MVSIKSITMVSAAALLLAGRAGLAADTRGTAAPQFSLEGRASTHADAERGPSVGGELGSVADDRRFDDLASDDDASDGHGAPFDTARCNPERRDYSALDCPWRE